MHRLFASRPLTGGAAPPEFGLALRLSPEIHKLGRGYDKDLRGDTYHQPRGGHHINRPTRRANHHLPTGIVVACQTTLAHRPSGWRSVLARGSTTDLERRAATSFSSEQGRYLFCSQIRHYVLAATGW